VFCGLLQVLRVSVFLLAARLLQLSVFVCSGLVCFVYPGLVLVSWYCYFVGLISLLVLFVCFNNIHLPFKKKNTGTLCITVPVCIFKLVQYRYEYAYRYSCTKVYRYEYAYRYNCIKVSYRYTQTNCTGMQVYISVYFYISVPVNSLSLLSRYTLFANGKSDKFFTLLIYI
jgi:hypothetical protein